MYEMNRLFRSFLALGIALAALGLAHDASAQNTGDAKRRLKAMKLFYKEPGLIEVEIRAMRTTLMMTGYVATEEDKAKCDELAGKIRGIKDVRNRIRVREPEALTATDAELTAKIEKRIQNDEELAREKEKGRFELDVSEANVTLTGKVKDWSLADSLVMAVKNSIGVKTINFEKLKY
jgi:osmotically-inducible protein OsmY